MSEEEDDNGINFLYDRVLYWVRQGRIIPPEAPDSRLNTAKSISGKSSGISRDSRSYKGDKERNNMDIRENAIKYPAKTFRHMDKVKASEPSVHKFQQPHFLHVLTGKGIQPRDSFELRKPLSPIRKPAETTRRITRDQYLRRQRRTSRDSVTLNVTSDTDSGLNTSFNTSSHTVGHSDNEQPSKESSMVHTPIPGQSAKSSTQLHRNNLKPPSNVQKHRFKDRNTRWEIRKESILSYITKSLEDIEYGKNITSISHW